MNVGREWTSLGKICENLDRIRHPITKSKRKKGNIPYYGASGIVDYVADFLFDEDLLLVSEDGANLLARTYPIAFSISGKTWVNNHAHVLRFANIESQHFIEYYLNSISLEAYVSGMAQPKLNQKKLNSIPVPLTTLAEQKRIVAILDDAFAAIDKVVANTEKNLANARELFNSYLNALLSGNENNWVNIELSELTEHITDGDHSPPPKSATGIPFITISNIDKTNNTIDFSDTFFVPKSYYQTLKGKRRPQYGDVLYTVTGSFGIPVIIDFKKEFCFQRHIGLIRPTNEIDSKCLYYILLSRMVREQATERATGTAQKTISLKVLRSIVIPKIPIDEQLDFVSRLDSLSGQTQKLESIYQQKLSALAELKQSILQKAFSGELTADAANLENVA